MRLVSTIFVILIFQLSLHAQNSDLTPPKISILEVSVLNENDESIVQLLKVNTPESPPNVINKPKNSKIKIVFTGVVSAKSDEISYKTRLVGFENEFTEKTNNNYVEYKNLKPGNYTLKIFACNSFGVWNLDAFLYNFEIVDQY